MPAAMKKTRIVTMRLTAAEKKQLEKLAREAGLTVSDYIKSHIQIGGAK